MMIWENVRTLRTFEVFRTAHEFDARKQGYSTWQQHRETSQIHVPFSAGIRRSRVPPATEDFFQITFLLLFFSCLSISLCVCLSLSLSLFFSLGSRTDRRDSRQRETVTRIRNGDSIFLDGNSFLPRHGRVNGWRRSINGI